MNAGILLIPFILIRYVLLRVLSGDALRRAAHYPPFPSAEKPMLVVYQAASLFLCGSLFFMKVRLEPSWFGWGLAVYCAGCALLAASTVNFAQPEQGGMNRAGLYRFSRNPMYVSYFVLFLGCVMLTQSWVLLALLIVFQVSGHWLVLAEERWCLKEFGEPYREYSSKVRRYF